MSGKIPDEPPEPSRDFHKEESSQQSKSPPKVKRSSIPPSQIPQEMGIEKLVSSAKGEKKRKKGETESSEKELEPLQSAEKKRELAPESKEKIDLLCSKVSKLFGPPPPNIDNLESLANFCFEAIRTRIHQPNYLKTDEIENFYQLLFETELMPICEPLLFEPVNPINPHPTYVIQSLYECIKALERYPTFEEAERAGENYIQEKRLGAFFQLDLATRNRILPEILSQAPDFQQTIDSCPVYTTKLLLGSENIHPAFVLRDSRHQPKWIFKPSCIIHLQELLMLNPEMPFEHSVREQTAYLVNHHHQFPVPITLLIDIKGSVGSAQLFIEGEKRQLMEADPSEIPNLELQKLLIFDLLFSNCDRHKGNILLTENAPLRIYGIDHDSCFSFDNRPLKIDYLSLASSFNCPLDQSIKHLVSEENITKYKEILRNQTVDENAITWMDDAAEAIRIAFETKINADLLAKNLMSEFKIKHVV